MIVTDCEPLVAEEERPGPKTVQLFTWEEFQAMVAVLPDLTRVGVAVIETIGEITVTVALAETDPPAPVHEITYFCVEERLPVERPPAGLVTAPPVEIPFVGVP